MFGKWTFKWEPVLWLSALQSALVLLSATPWVHLNPTTAAWILTATSAVFAVIEAAMTRPFTPAALVGLIRTILTAAALFGFASSDDFRTALIGFATMVYGMVVRNGVEPKAGPVLATNVNRIETRL